MLGFSILKSIYPLRVCVCVSLLSAAAVEGEHDARCCSGALANLANLFSSADLKLLWVNNTYNRVSSACSENVLTYRSYRSYHIVLKLFLCSWAANSSSDSYNIHPSCSVSSGSDCGEHGFCQLLAPPSAAMTHSTVSLWDWKGLEMWYRRIITCFYRASAAGQMPWIGKIE